MTAKPAKTVRDEFLGTMSRNPRVDERVIRAMKIYFNNKQRNPRLQRDMDFRMLREHGPYKVSMQTEADYWHKLAKRCYLDPYPQKPNGLVWRNTDFTRRFSAQKRAIMDDFANIWLVRFSDQQSEHSLSWENANRSGHEAWEVQPVWRISAKNGNYFDFIINSWQSGRDPIVFM